MRGDIGKVLDQLPDARLELDRSHDPHLETEASQRATQVIVEGDGLRLHKLAMGQKGLMHCSKFAFSARFLSADAHYWCHSDQPDR